MSSTPPPNSPRQTAMPSTCPSSSPTVAPPSLQHAYGQSDSSRQSNIESPLQVLQDGRQFLTIPLFGHEPPNDHSRYHRPQGHVPSGTSTITLIIPPEDSVDTSATDVSATLGARRSRSLYQEDACPFQITETIRPASVVSHGCSTCNDGFPSCGLATSDDSVTCEHCSEPWVTCCSSCCPSEAGEDSVSQGDRPVGKREDQGIEHHQHRSHAHNDQRLPCSPCSRYLTVPGQAYVAADRQHNRVPSTSGLSISASTRSSLSAAIPESTVAYSYSSSDETISNRPRWMRRWRPSLRRGGQEREATPNSSDDEYESDHRRSPSRSRERQSRRTRRTPLPRRGTDERGGVQGIQHALRIGFLSTLGPGIPVTPTASVFGEQLADGMFNKNNPGGLFGYSREEERRLVRKIDWRLIPILGTFYSLSTLNRVNFANARIFAFETALHATGEQYTWAIAIFYCGFGLAEIPTIFALLHFTPKVWLPMSMFAWATVTFSMGWTRNLPSVMVLRFLLGVSEAALIPGVLIYIAMFYKRSEQTFRLAILALFNAAAGAFGGLIAGAIGLIHGAAGLDGWQWVFILEAILTATCAVAAYFILAKTPETAPWLNQRETSIAIYRIRNDTKLKVNRSFSKKTVLSAVKDPKVYIFMVLNLILTSLVASSIPVMTRAWMDAATETMKRVSPIRGERGNGSLSNATSSIPIQGHYMSTSPSLFSWDPIFPPDNDIFAPLMKKRQAAQAAPHPPSRTQASRTRRHSLHPTNFLPPRAPPHSRMPLASPYLTASAPGPSTTIPPSTISLSITTTPEPLPSPIPEDESLFPLPAPDDTETPSSSPGQPVTGVDSAFQETTVKERILAQLMSSPPYLVGGLVTFAVALVVDRTQQRAYMIVGLALVTMSGYACELATTNSYARYAASFFIYSGQSAMVPVVTSWITTNVGAYAKRAIAVAMFQLAASLGGITGSLIYHSKGAPRHIRGHSLNICMLVMLIAFTALQRWRLWRENRRRNYSVAFGLNPIRRLSKNEIRDLGDQHPAFRYTI